MRYVTVCFCALALACAAHLDRRAQESLRSRSSLLSFTIAVDEANSRPDSTKVTFLLANISGQTVYVEVPECFGINIYPFATDSAGHSLQVQFSHRVHCAGILAKLGVGDTLKTPFGHTIEACFGIPHGTGYSLHFEYRGRVFDETEHMLSDSVPLLSNTLVMK